MKWSGSEWDRVPRVYKEGATILGKAALVTEDWEECKAHLVALWTAKEARAQKTFDVARQTLEQTQNAVRVATMATKPEA